MHIVLAVIGVAVAAYVWMMRAQRGAQAAGELMDMAADVKNAARRFGFRRRAGQHPVNSIEDPKLAIGALAAAYIELDDLPTADARARVDISLRKRLNIDGAAAQEIAILGRWLVTECGGAEPAFPRLAKKLKAIDGAHSFDLLMAVLGDAGQTKGSMPSPRQSQALGDLAQIFRMA